MNTIYDTKTNREYNKDSVVAELGIELNFTMPAKKLLITLDEEIYLMFLGGLTVSLTKEFPGRFLYVDYKNKYYQTQKQ